jgi:hypothetical protein
VGRQGGREGPLQEGRGLLEEVVRVKRDRWRSGARRERGLGVGGLLEGGYGGGE